MSLDTKALSDFKQGLKNLCAQYGIFIQQQGERRERPGDYNYYYEWKLIARVKGESELLIEEKKENPLTR